MARSIGSIHVADNSVTAVNDALQQLLFLIDELRGEHSSTTIFVGPHTHQGGMSGSDTTAQDGGPITPQTIDHDDLINVTANQHHAQLHASAHGPGGSDALKLDDLATPDDNTDLNASASAHGLLPKLSGSTNEFLRGDGTFAAATSVEATDVANIEGSTQEQPWENILAGSNITITEIANGNAITIAATASGGSLGIWLPDAPPSSAGADDDEFADASGGVPSGWTEVDHGTVITVDEDSIGLELNYNSGSTGQNAGIYKAIPAGDFTIWAKCSMTGLAATDQAGAGLALWEDATSSTGDLITFYNLVKNASDGAYLWAWSQYNTFGSTLATEVTGNFAITTLYLRIRRSTTTYAFDYSRDGICWVRLYSNTISFTPTHYGPVIYNNTSNSYSARFQFFRYQNSDIGLNGISSGKRV